MKIKNIVPIIYLLCAITFLSGNKIEIKDNQDIKNYPKVIQLQLNSFNEYLFGTLVKRGYPIGSEESRYYWINSDIIKLDKVIENEFIHDPRSAFERYYKLYDYLIKHIVDKNDFYTLLSIYLDSIENIKYINSRGEYILNEKENKGFISMFYKLSANGNFSAKNNQENLTVEENLLNLKIRMSKFFYRRGKAFTDLFKEYSLRILNENPSNFSNNIISKFNNNDYDKNIYNSSQKKLVSKYYKSEIKTIPIIEKTIINDNYHIIIEKKGDSFSSEALWKIINTKNKKVIFNEKMLDKDSYEDKYQITIQQDDKNLLINEWTGGAHCCYSSRIFKKDEDKSIVFKKILYMGNCKVSLENNYIKSCDDSFSYFLTSFAGSPMPELIFDRDLNLQIGEMKKLNDIEYKKALKDSIEDTYFLSVDNIKFAYKLMYDKELKRNIIPYFSQNLYTYLVFYIYNGNLELAKKLYTDYNKIQQLELKGKGFNSKDNDLVLELIIKNFKDSSHGNKIYEYYKSKNINFNFRDYLD